MKLFYKWNDPTENTGRAEMISEGVDVDSLSPDLLQTQDLNESNEKIIIQFFF